MQQGSRVTPAPAPPPSGHGGRHWLVVVSGQWLTCTPHQPGAPALSRGLEQGLPQNPPTTGPKRAQRGEGRVTSTLPLCPQSRNLPLSP